MADKEQLTEDVRALREERQRLVAECGRMESQLAAVTQWEAERATIQRKVQENQQYLEDTLARERERMSNEVVAMQTRFNEATSRQLAVSNRLSAQRNALDAVAIRMLGVLSGFFNDEEQREFEGWISEARGAGGDGGADEKGEQSAQPRAEG